MKEKKEAGKRPTAWCSLPAQDAAHFGFTAPANDVKAINSLLADYAAALKAESPQQTAALFTANDVVMPPAGPTAAGKAGVENNYKGLFSGTCLDLDFTVLEMNVVGKYAFVRSTSTGPITNKNRPGRLPRTVGAGKNQRAMENRPLLHVQPVALSGKQKSRSS